MQSLQRLANAVAQSPKSSPSPAGLGAVMKVYSGTFQGPEAVDPNLSQITIGQNPFRFVPRLQGSWTSTPSAGTTILVGSVNGGLIILGAQMGNTALATHP